METTVTLQHAFEYSLWVILLGILVFLIALVLFVRAVKKIKKQKRESCPNSVMREYRPAPARVVMDAKTRYTLQIKRIMDEYNAKDITKREGYQRLSLIIRGFVHETTGINVEKYTLSDIQTLGMPGLNTLISEYYLPEFAQDDMAAYSGLWTSCNRTIGVINQWR